MPLKLTRDDKVIRDADGVVRQIRHRRRGYTQGDSQVLTATLASDETATPRQLADEYLREALPHFGLRDQMADDLSAAFAEAAPVDEAPRLRYLEEKKAGSQALVSYVHTELGLPVWREGVSVKMAGPPYQVVASSSSVQTGIEVNPPSADAPYLPEKINSAIFAGLVNLPGEPPKINRTRLLIYQLDPDDRGNASGEPGESDERDAHIAGPVISLPDLPEQLEAGRYYVATEVLFTYLMEGWGELNWRAFVEPETGAILRLDAFVGCIDGLVYLRDPLTKTGDATLRPDSPNFRLDAQRDRVTLVGLEDPGPTPARQELRGEYVRLLNIITPSSAPPTSPQDQDFEFPVASDDFAAVNAYYHCDRLFRMIDNMGLDVADYFDGTTFPVRVDHRVSYPDQFNILRSNVVNASAPGNVAGNGSDGFRFALVQRDTNVGMAVEWRVVLHEFGHTVLWDHLDSPNFRFAHSPGDSLGAILNDPGSQAPDRFDTFPWTPIRRRHDRRVEDGWGWGGSFDDPFPVGHPFSGDRAGYRREQILSSTLFRFYRAVGGDHSDVAVREETARLTAFLIFSAIGVLSSIAPPQNAEDFAEELIDADLGLTSFEGYPGGTVHKVIRWSFERQGSYQPLGAPTPVVDPGAPPDVDVFIDDGRGGGYDPRDHFVFSSEDIWNRRAADAGTLHESPLAGQTNFLYVRVRNRGTQPAENIRVDAHLTSEIGQRPWPDAWSPLDTPTVAAGDSLAPEGETVVGPFEWTPQAEGGIAMLCSVSAEGDPSNAESVAGSIPVVRLTHCDNNLAGRLMTVLAEEPETGSGINVETQPRTAIPDADSAGIVSQLSVSDSGSIASLSVSVAVVHSYRGDLLLTLISPAGTQAVIFQGDFADSDSNVIETFSSADLATLQNVVGEDPSGIWRLRVVDRLGLDVGTLERWGLAIKLN